MRLTIVRAVDEFSASIVMLVANSQSVSATLNCEDQFNVYLTLELTGATVTDYVVSGAGDTSSEQITFVSTSVSMTTGNSFVTI